jgi:hypothetical protein
MTGERKIYAGAVGVEIILDTGQDITAAGTKEILFKKPVSGLTGAWTGTAYQTSKVKYVTIVGDLLEAGIYLFQTHVKWSDLNEHFGEVFEYEVHEKLTLP